MSAAQQSAEHGQPRASFAPMLPLALLESMRNHDRPREVLEDEDLAASLPRRLGLTGVIESQIHRYEEAARRNRPVPAEEVLDLVRLVLRRPDAEPILREAGVQIARRHFSRIATAAASALSVLPRAALLAATRRAARTMLASITGQARIELSGRPLAARIFDPPTAHLLSAGTACILYGAALEELITLYTRDRPRLAHARCVARSEECCEWILEEA